MSLATFSVTSCTRSRTSATCSSKRRSC